MINVLSSKREINHRGHLLYSDIAITEKAYSWLEAALRAAEVYLLIRQIIILRSLVNNPCFPIDSFGPKLLLSLEKHHATPAKSILVAYCAFNESKVQIKIANMALFQRPSALTSLILVG